MKKIFLTLMEQFGAAAATTGLVFYALDLIVGYLPLDPDIRNIIQEHIALISFIMAGIIGLLVPTKRTLSKKIIIKRDIKDVWDFIIDPFHDEKMNNDVKVTVFQKASGKLKWKISKKADLGEIIIFVRELNSKAHELWEVEAFEVNDTGHSQDVENKFVIFNEIPPKAVKAHAVDTYEFKKLNGSTELISRMTLSEKRGPYFKFMAFMLTKITNPNAIFLRKVKNYLEKHK